VIGAKGLGRFDDIPSEFFVLQKVEGFDEPQFFPVGQSPKLCTSYSFYWPATVSFQPASGYRRRA